MTVAPQPVSELVLPSSDDPVVAAAVTAVGGPPGRHARLSGRRLWTPVRVLIALTLLTCTLGLLEKSPCLDPASWVHQHQYTRGCYTDLLPLYSNEGLADGQRPYLDHKVEYPVLIGGLMQVAADAVKPFAPASRSTRFVEITIALMTACAVVTAICLTRVSGRRPWDAALFALSPGLLLAGFINWDLAAAAFLGLGLLAWARRHPVWAGVALGLGGATKLYPLVLLAPLALLCIRAGRWKELGLTLLGSASAWLVVNLPIALAAPAGWRYFYTFSQQRGADWGSVFYVLQYFRGPLDTNLAPNQSPHLLNLAASLAFLAGLAGVAVLTFTARRRPRLAQVMFLTLAAFCLSNKVYSPQYVIWLLPLAALARPRWGAFLAWQASEVIAFFAIWYYLVTVSVAGQGIGASWYFAALLTRDVVLLGLCALVVRDVLHPEHDVVRRDGADDPAGGVLDGAEDRILIARRPAPAVSSRPPRPVRV